jgi:hypothetical protein
MRIRSAETTLSNFKDKDGNDQYQLLLTWEISRPMKIFPMPVKAY